MEQQRPALTVGCHGPVISAFLVALLGTLCCHIAADTPPDLRPPKIEALTKSTFNPRPGKPLNLSCEADPGFPGVFTLIYWLVNNTFVELLHPAGRITEGEESESTVNNSVVVRKDLMLTVVKPKDFSASYTCVVMSPTGKDSRTVRLRRRKR
ncbi:interleukin-18-binding protein-like isoform X2 [Brienomyrus brachyistius]|nr:interleukin-18-binding protein-like isoform X2 [Brienomyrus brachyistius]